MLPPDFSSTFIEEHPNLLRDLLDAKRPLRHWGLVQSDDPREPLLLFAAHEAASDEVALPLAYCAEVVAELEKPRPDDELTVFVVRGEELAGVAHIPQGKIEREIGEPYTIDARNHLPAPLPRGWEGPYAVPGYEGCYRVDTRECEVLARICDEWDYDDLDEDGNPRLVRRFEIGVTQAFDAALPSDEQIAAITAPMRHCGPFEDRTQLAKRRHPSRRVLAARVEAQRGLAWAEVRPMPEVLGPPPAWEVVGSFRARPLVFRIAGTKLRVTWSAPAGVDWMSAATGRSSEPSRLVVQHDGARAPNDEEIGVVFTTMGTSSYVEKKRPRAVEKKGRERVFMTTAAWLRRREPGHS